MSTPQIGIVTGRFPNVSQTFVLDHITAMLDLGYDVRIIAAQPGSDRADAVPDDGNLARRTTHYRAQGSEVLRPLVDSGHLLFKRPSALMAVLAAATRRETDARTSASMTRVLADIGRLGLYHCHFGNRGLVVAISLLALGWKTPLVTTFHGYDATKLVQAHGEGMYAPLFNRADLLLPVSNHLRRRLLALGAPADRTIVHHLGVHCDRIWFRTNREPAAPVRVLSVARLVEKKGIEFGIRAVARAREAGVHLRYDVIGDGPLAGHLSALVQELGLDADVSLLGARDRQVVGDHMSRAHILLAPSVTATDGDEEGIPVVLMEAMASGLPVISTAHSGIPEIVQHDRTGLLSPERAVEDLAGHLKRLAEDPQLRQTLATNAREFIEQEFDASRQNAQLAGYYDSLCRWRPSPVS